MSKTYTKRKYYTEEELNFIKDNYISKGIQYCCDILNRPKANIYDKATKLGLNVTYDINGKISINNKHFTKEQIQFLKENYSFKGSKECSQILGKTPHAIESKASKLGLKVLYSHKSGLPRKPREIDFTEHELEILYKYYNSHGSEYCAKFINRSKQCICRKASSIGLKVNIQLANKNNPERLRKQKATAELRKSLTLEQEQEVIKLYSSGLSCNDIKKIYSCSKPVILKVLKNIPKRKPGEYSNHISKNQGFGPTHHTWKGGIKSVYDRIRDLDKYKQWRLSVFMRDNSQCTKCGEKQNKHAHHMITLKTLINNYCKEHYKEIVDLDQNDLNSDYFYDLSNGLTLCEPCHKNWHFEHGRK